MYGMYFTVYIIITLGSKESVHLYFLNVWRATQMNKLLAA